MPKKKIVFEDAISEMENIIDLIEQGEIPLSKSIELYKKGINLSMECSELLQGIEQEVTLLYKNTVIPEENQENQDHIEEKVFNYNED